MSDDPVRDCLAAGMQALLRGDTAERDRQVERARRIMDAQEAVPKVDVSPDQIVPALLRLVEAKVGRPLAQEERAAIEADPARFMRGMIAAQEAARRRA